jgi:threonine/homoserine/homoserine lactone efflux protein
MFPTEILLAYLAACVVVVVAPGPDNILAISRGLSQGRAAACLSSVGAGPKPGLFVPGLTFIASGLSVLALKQRA